MSVVVSFSFPPELARNATVRQALLNAGLFVRDLWLARAPYATGGYAKGLQHSGSVKIESDRLVIENKCPYSAVVEHGFRSFNIGLAMLRNGRGVRIDSSGNRFKIVRIEPKARGATRSAGAASQVIKSFQKLIPIGMRVPKLNRYGGLKSYAPRRSLQRPIKGKTPLAGSPRGFFVVSEKAIRENPTKWQMPARKGLKLGEQVQKESSPYVKEAVRKAVLAEKERQVRSKNSKPGWWSAAIARNPLKTIPMEKPQGRSR